MKIPALSLSPVSWPMAWPESTVPVAVKPRYIRHTRAIGMQAP